VSEWRKCVVCGAVAGNECINCGSLPAMVSRERIAALRHRAEELQAELERVQQLPELEWAEVTARIMTIVARLARNGFASEARDMKEALDAGKTYVTRLRAGREPKAVTPRVANQEDTE
jgi:hypothetical protein